MTEQVGQALSPVQFSSNSRRERAVFLFASLRLCESNVFRRSAADMIGKPRLLPLRVPALIADPCCVAVDVFFLAKSQRRKEERWQFAPWREVSLPFAGGNCD